MSQGIGVVGLYVRDQDEAIEFYVGKLGFRVHTDARNGDYRWLTVQHLGQEQHLDASGPKDRPPPAGRWCASRCPSGIAARCHCPVGLAWSDRAPRRRSRALRAR